MELIRIRPEHVPHVLRIFEIKKGYAELFIKLNYSPEYDRDVFLNALPFLSEDGIYHIVPSIDTICEICPKKDICTKTDALLFQPLNEHLKSLPKDQRKSFLQNSLYYFAKEELMLTQSFPFTHLIGKTYDLKQMYFIRDNPYIVLENF